MPCPADPPVEVERFQLLHDFEKNHVNGFGRLDNLPRQSLSASRLVSPSRVFDTSDTTDSVNGNGALFPSLKAVPLASYYKLHRVPSLSSMTDPDSDDMGTVPLPRRESTTEPPPEPVLQNQNGVHNKILEQVVRTPGRQPSPQPTHLSVPGPGQPRVLHEEGSGYVAPKFEGKDLQMEQGREQ